MPDIFNPDYAVATYCGLKSLAAKILRRRHMCKYVEKQIRIL